MVLVTNYFSFYPDFYRSFSLKSHQLILANLYSFIDNCIPLNVISTDSYDALQLREYLTVIPKFIPGLYSYKISMHLAISLNDQKPRVVTAKYQTILLL